jgi:homoserine kinase type II
MTNTNTISEVLEKIRKTYSFADKVEFLENVNSGYLSQNFILKNNDNKFFLKQYRFDNIQKVNTVHQVKFFFANGNIPIILPIKNDLDEYVFEHKNMIYSLFPYVDGKIIERSKLSAKAFESSGKMLAKIHSLSRNDFPKILQNHTKGWKKKDFLSDTQTLIDKIESIKLKTDFDKLALDTIRYKNTLVSNNYLKYEELDLQNNHIIHGDYHEQNIFYDKNSEVKFIFDIEKTEIAPRVLEIARSMDLMCFSGNYELKNFKNANIYLTAYNKIYPTNHNELKRGIMAYYLKKAHSLWIEKEHYLKNNSRVDCFLQGELSMLKYYAQNIETFFEKLKIKN